MNITLAIDDNTVKEAREVVKAMGKSLNQLIREELERLTKKHHLEQTLEELILLVGQANAQGWKLNREVLHDSTSRRGY